MTEEGSLYITLIREIGRRLFKKKGDLFGFGRQVIMPCF